MDDKPLDLSNKSFYVMTESQHRSSENQQESVKENERIIDGSNVSSHDKELSKLKKMSSKTAGKENFESVHCEPEKRENKTQASEETIPRRIVSSKRKLEMKLATKSAGKRLTHLGSTSGVVYKNKTRSIANSNCSKTAESRCNGSKHSTSLCCSKDSPEIQEYFTERNAKQSSICEYCGESFISVSKYVNHVSIRTLREHMQRHTGEKPFKCSECEKAFATKNDQYHHMQRHNENKPFKCSECEKAFKTKKEQSNHMKRHTEDRPFKCTNCIKAFKSKGELKMHMKRHTGEKPFKCTECEMASITIYELNAHMRIHNGERPFKCTECKKAFTSVGNLARHKKIHSVEKCFICSVCGRAFKRNDHLRRHKITHKEKTKE